MVLWFLTWELIVKGHSPTCGCFGPTFRCTCAVQEAGCRTSYPAKIPE